MNIFMQTVKLICILWSGCVMAKNHTDLLSRIQEELPEGWSVAKTANQFVVKKDDPVLARLITPSMSGTEKPQPVPYAFILIEVDRVSPDEYTALKQKYARFEQEAERLCRNARINEIPHEITKTPPWEFVYQPRSEAESQAVAQYKALYAGIKGLPDVYTDDHSYVVEQLRYEFADTSKQHECEKVRKDVLEIFHAYEKESH